jgi:hypothetical protein
MKEQPSNNDVSNKIVLLIGLCDFFFSINFIVAGVIGSKKYFSTEVCTWLGLWTHFWGLGTVRQTKRHIEIVLEILF